MIEGANTFYFYTELSLSLIGAILLMAIWRNIRTVFKRKLSDDESVKRVDKGLFYLSLAMMVWVIKGIAFLSAPDLGPITSQVVDVIFSLINSLFFILALSFFDYAPAFISYNRKNVIRLITVFTLISLFSLSIFIFLDKGVDRGFNYSSFPDLIISGVLSYLLLVSFYKTFKERHLPLIALFSVVAIIIMFVSQIMSVYPFSNEFTLYVDLIKIIAKSSLISICLVLAVSWVIELAQTPTSSEMSLNFTDWSHVVLNIPSKGIINKKIDFGSRTKQFRNLLKFAIRRKYAPVNEHCIEIIKGGEIQGQTYLTRIVEELNKVDSSEILERKDVFTFVGLGRYRIRFLPENIDIEPALLYEFINEDGLDAYKLFCKS